MDRLLAHRPIELIAIDMDGTLLGADGKVSRRNLKALKDAECAGIPVLIATGRRHGYAMRQLRNLGLDPESVIISSNGAVTRTVGAGVAGSRLLNRSLLSLDTARWLCRHLEEFHNALVLTFDRVGPDGEDARGTLVVQGMAELNASIGRWMEVNEPYIEHVGQVGQAVEREGLIQMMVCGTLERMRQAEARLLEDGRVWAASAALEASRGEVRDVERARRLDDGSVASAEVALHRTEYPERDLCILDILPAGCSKGNAVQLYMEKSGQNMVNCMAIGDNWNDVSMLEAAGHPVLMANAPEDLKLLAMERGWRIGGHHLEDGVAEAIEGVLEAVGTRAAPEPSGRL